VEVETGTSIRRRWYLCIPEAAFPFVAADVIRATSQAIGLGARKLTIRNDTGAGELVILSGSDTAVLGEVGGALIPHPCAGDRTGCGAYTVPASLELAGVTLLPGSDEILQIGSRPARIFVGRAERVIAAPLGCEAGRDRAAMRADIAILYPEQTP
jgi:hypothetical protein